MTGHSAATQIEWDANQRPAVDRQGLATWWRTGIQPEQLVLVLVAGPARVWTALLGRLWTNMKTERCVPTYCKSLYKQLSKSQRSAKSHVDVYWKYLKIMEKQDQQSWIDATTYHWTTPDLIAEPWSKKTGSWPVSHLFSRIQCFYTLHHVKGAAVFWCGARDHIHIFPRPGYEV